MDERSLKLNLANQITTKHAHEFQSQIFLATMNEFAFLSLNDSIASLDAALSYIIVDTYWHPNSKNLYVALDVPTAAKCRESAKAIFDNLKEIRPERTYHTADLDFMSIKFGDVMSSLFIQPYDKKFISDGYSNIVIDVPYNKITLAHLSKFMVSLAPRNAKLTIITRNDKLHMKTVHSAIDNKLDNLLLEINFDGKE